MPVSRELSVVYASTTFGGSTARQIDGYTIVEKDYTTAAFEFSFITSASSAAAFATECSTVEAALRKPRQDLTVTLGASTLLSLKQSDNTGFDANPTIIKQGDVGDTGRSRFYHARIEFGLPADNLSLSFRRFSTVNVEYTPERQRIVTITGTYTANSTDGTTGSFATYLANAPTYFSSVLTGIDNAATWEKIGEPQVERNETDKVTNFTVVYKEILFNQSNAGLDDSGLVDPTFSITRTAIAPGDSDSSSIGLGGSGSGTSTTAPGVNSGTDPTVAVINTGSPGSTVTGSIRPTILTVNYTVGIDATVIKGLQNMMDKWTNTIRPFIIAQVGVAASGNLVLMEQSPNFGDLYANRFSATMIFHSYTSTILSQRITVSDQTNEGKSLRFVWSGDPYEYYEYRAGKVRLKTVTEEREETTGLSDVNAYVETLVKNNPVPTGLPDADKWTVLDRTPRAAVLKRGMLGATQPYVAETVIVTVMQYRKKKAPSTANAGGVTGGVSTL
jgi:hypothetical protein